MDNKNLNRLAHLYNEQYYTAHHSNNDVYRKNQVKINPIEILQIRNGLDSFTDVKVRVSSLVIDSGFNGNMKEISWEGKLQNWYQALLNNTLEIASK